MTDVTVKRFDEMDKGLGGVLVRVRAELGVSSFGMQVIDLPPHFDQPYAEHAHEGFAYEPANDGQEEVYLPLEGRATLLAGDERFELVPGMAARVGPAQLRRIVTGDEPCRMLAVGGMPGRAYTPPAFTEIGAPDPDPAATAG
jgi:hypothetical protein